MGCNLKTNYAVASKEIFLTVKIGDGQIGASYAAINNKKVAAGQIKDEKIGDGVKLKGKSLTVKTIVADVNNQTNHTSVTYILAGGLKDDQYGLEASVAQNGASIIYQAEIDFI